MAFPVFSVLVTLFVATRIVKLVKGVRAIHGLPGIRVPFYPMAIPGAVFPTSWWNPGNNAWWTWRHTAYKRFNSEHYSIVPFLVGPPTIVSSNVDVAHQIVTGAQDNGFTKPQTASFRLWGENVLSAENDEWRRHRKVLGPAFSTSLNKLVWDTSRSMYQDMIAVKGSEWKNDVVDVSSVQKITYKLALLIVGTCGFGADFSWDDPPSSANGQMSVQESLRVVAENITLAIAAPKWVWSLPFETIRHFVTAHDVLDQFMRIQVAERKLQVRMDIAMGDEGKMDTLSRLVRANELDHTLDDGEILGNMFLLLVAGHETTAGSLASTLALLALHPEIQEETYAEIMSVVGNYRDPEFEDFGALYKVSSVFHEALRLCPPSALLSREVAQDTVISLPRPVGQTGFESVPIAKGSHVIIDVIGINYNERYYDSPLEFRPSRWYKGTDNFHEFGIAPRACLGRRFAVHEAVSWLTMVLRDWRVEPMLDKDESLEAWKGKVFTGTQNITLSMGTVPLRWIRRTAGGAVAGKP